MAKTRPRVFVSSTVYDFCDLRSALKYFLEELGYEVLLSENNDFPVQVDLNSYESCLRAIDDCEYVIVLIGSRVGGWYDAPHRISITQAEYRRAYTRLVQGQAKLLAFVRQDVWTVREDRNALERLFKSEALHDAELDDSAIGKIARHPSKFANDAEFTFQFLKEVARIEEMKAAAAGQSEFPAGNWLRQFSSFRDIVDALRVEFRVSASLRQAALLANLRTEIESNLRVLADQDAGENSLTPKYMPAHFARNEISGDREASSAIKRKHLRWLAMFALNGCGLGRKLSTSALDEALTSGEMLDFDREADAYVVGPMQQALLDLKRNIERLRHKDESLDWNRRIKFGVQFTQLDGEESMRIRNIEIVQVLSAHDIQFNVVSLCRAIYRAAAGDVIALDGVVLYGDSPLDSENEKMGRERPSLEQVRHWLDEEG